MQINKGVRVMWSEEYTKKAEQMGYPERKISSIRNTYENAYADGNTRAAEIFLEQKLSKNYSPISAHTFD